MNKEEIKELLEKLKQCDDFHNRCDFLMEHSEITYMLDYITKLQQENQKLKDNWNKLRETLKNEQLGSILYSDKKRFADIDEILLKMQELEKSDGNE